MKKKLLMSILLNWKNLDRSLKKKIMIGLGVVAVFLIFSFSLVAYVGVKTASYLVSKAPTQEQMGTITQGLAEQGKALVGATKPTTCLLELQNHLDLNIWLSQPIAEITGKLFKACFEMPIVEPEEKPEEP